MMVLYVISDKRMQGLKIFLVFFSCYLSEARNFLSGSDVITTYAQGVWAATVRRT